MAKTADRHLKEQRRTHTPVGRPASGLWPTNELEPLVPESTFVHRAAAIKPHHEYRKDPIGWAVTKLGVRRETLEWSTHLAYDGHRWDGTENPAMAMLDGIAAGFDVGVESGTGTGKSYAAAVVVLWFLACWEGAQVYTFAPVEKQLKLYIWKHITEFWPRFKHHFPQAELTDLTIRMKGGIDESWAAHGYAVGVKSDQSVSISASGMHAEHMLLIYEEAPGIPVPVWAAGENTCTAPHNIRLAIGNPNHRLDPLHRFCATPGVVHIRMSALDHPNVVRADARIIPGAVSQTSIEKRRLAYGETSPVYQSRVRGVSPEQASDALIRLEWLQDSARRYEARLHEGGVPRTVTGKGVDVANSEHGDRRCIVDFAENCVIRVEAAACPDANALGRLVCLEIEASQMDPRRVGIDAIGVGAGTVNECRRLKKNVTAIVNSGSPMKMTEKGADGAEREWSPDVNMFRNLRSQTYWQLREDFRTNRIDMAQNAELWEELTTFTFVDEPKTIVEPKDEVRDRLGRSPDMADALVMANWVRLRHVAPSKHAQAPDKTAHKAHQLVVKDGRIIPQPKAPKTIEELAEWASGAGRRRAQQSNPERRRPTRRVYW